MRRRTPAVFSCTICAMLKALSFVCVSNFSITHKSPAAFGVEKPSSRGRYSSAGACYYTIPSFLLLTEKISLISPNIQIVICSRNMTRICCSIRNRLRGADDYARRRRAGRHDDRREALSTTLLPSESIVSILIFPCCVLTTPPPLRYYLSRPRTFAATP